MSVVDTFDAMTSDRPYRKAKSFRMSLKEIRDCSGTQFDPHIADALLDAWEKGLIDKRRLIVKRRS